MRSDRNVKDSFGKQMVYLYRAPDGLFVNLEIVRRGMDTTGFKFDKLFLHYEANEGRKGAYEKVNSEMVISEIQSLYRDENDLFRTVVKRIYEQWNAQLQQWDLRRIEFIFEDPELPVRSDNPAVAVEQRHGWLIPPEWEFQSEVWEYERKPIDGDRGKTVEHFDESEVREIEIDDRNYPELLKRIKKPPKALRVRGNLPPNRKIIAISGSRETTKQALDAAYRIGKMLAQHGYTIVDWTCPWLRHCCY